MSIVVNQSGTWVQGNAYLGYSNLLNREGAIVTATDSDADFPAINVASWRTYEKWQRTFQGYETYLYLSLPEVTGVNSFGMARHNVGSIYSQAYVEFEYSLDNGITWTTLASVGLSSRDDTIFRVFDTVNAKLFRLAFLGLPSWRTFSIYCGNLFIGNSLQLFSPPAMGFTPPELALKNEYISNRSEGGDYLGRTLLRKASETGFSMSQVAASWVNDDWEIAMRSMEQHPFYFVWDSTNYPTSVGFCYIEGTIAKPSYTSQSHCTVPLKFKVLS